MPPEERPLLDPIDTIAREGTLSRRLLSALNGDFRREALAEVYRRLCDCLDAGDLFHA
jgi:hypothetical protein